MGVGGVGAVGVVVGVGHLVVGHIGVGSGSDQIDEG